jgi:hypothetical protein
MTARFRNSAHDRPKRQVETDMTKLIPLSSAAALMLALAGCGSEPAKESDATPEPAEIPAGEAPPIADTVPAADDAPAASDPAAPHAAKAPETTRPKQDPARKAGPPPETKTVPDAPKPAEPDPHAGHDMDKK